MRSICCVREQPLFERKEHLRKLLTRSARTVLYVEHVASGTDLFRVVRDRDVEGVVTKQATAKYTLQTTTWVKIKNRQYSQAVGREDFLTVRSFGGLAGVPLSSNAADFRGFFQPPEDIASKLAPSSMRSELLAALLLQLRPILALSHNVERLD
jgi:hypothetical protein